MDAIGIIPARWASTRLPGKSLVSICGRPMIEWVLTGASRALRLDDISVATDDDRIREAVEAAGYCAVMTRSNHPSGTDRVAEAAAGRDADVIVNIQGDEPLIDPALIDRIVEEMQEDATWDMASAAVPIEGEMEKSDPAVVKVVWGRGGQALYFSRSVIPHVRDAADAVTGLHWRHLGIYAYRAAFLERLVAEPPSELEQVEKLEQLRALHLGASIKIVRWKGQMIGVDTPEDVARAEARIRELGLDAGQSVPGK